MVFCKVWKLVNLYWNSLACSFMYCLWLLLCYNSRVHSCCRDSITLYRRRLHTHFTKHFDKHYVHGIFLTVCSTGKADISLPSPQIRKRRFEWWSTLSYTAGQNEGHSSNLDLCNVLFSYSLLRLSKRCFYGSQKKIHLKSKNYIN